MAVGGAEKTLSDEVDSGVEGADNMMCTLNGVTFSVRHHEESTRSRWPTGTVWDDQ